MAETMLENLDIKTEPTPGDGAKKYAQLLLRRKLITQWESLNIAIPEGEPCFGYNPQTQDYILKVGTRNSDGDELLWNELKLLRCRVDDGELI